MGMPLQNRVDPFGAIHTTPERGSFMGNRGGCFHTADKTLGRVRWKSRQWIFCVLSFKNRRRELMSPGRYTELFFLDEVTALAAGHRPCFECQRQKANEFRQAVISSGLLAANTKAKDLDHLIAGEIQSRLLGKTGYETVQVADLPDGTMFSSEGHAYLKWQSAAWTWSFSGYSKSALPEAGFRLTPVATLAALKAGFLPQPHDSARLQMN